MDQAMLIVGERVSVAPNDKEELPPTVAAISPVVVAEVQAILVDSGFYSEAAVQAVEQKADGTATGLTVYAAVEKHSHHQTVADLLPQPEPAALGSEATAKEIMTHRLKTEVGKALYKLRKQTVEPVFGIIKEVMGFRRFTLRGREQVSLEWTMPIRLVANPAGAPVSDPAREGENGSRRIRRSALRCKMTDNRIGMEWTLVCVSYNLKRMFTLKNLVPTG